MGFSRQEYWSGLPFPSPVDHILSKFSTMTCPSWVTLQGMAHSFIELDKAVVHVIRSVSFLWLWFSFCLPSDGKGEEAYWSFLMGETDWRGNWGSGGMLSKSLCWLVGLCSLLFDLRWNYDGGNEDNGSLFQKVPCMNCCTERTWPGSKPLPTHISAGDSWTLRGKSGSVSYVVTALFSWVLVCTRFYLCLLRVCFTVLCKFWQLYGRVNGDLLQEGLCYTQVSCTQSPFPCSRPLLTCTSTGNTQTLKGWSGSVSGEFPRCAEGFVWTLWLSQVGMGLILNVISPLLLFCWGFSFALWHGVYLFGGVQHSLVDACSAASCNPGVLAGEDQCMSFYSAINKCIYLS